MNLFELNPRYDARASFYNKAKVRETKKFIYLYSYDLLVARVDKEKRLIKLYNIEDHSQTTKRHIRDFYRQYAMVSLDNARANKEIWG